MNKIKVYVNGKEIEIQQNSTIEDLIITRNITGTMFVIEKNMKIVQKSNYSKEIIFDKDKIEIAGFFGGG